MSDHRNLRAKITAPNAADHDITLRQYFVLLLKKLFSEEEGFSGKRPFGDSGWVQQDIAASLVAHGEIEGMLVRDEDGYIVELTYDEEELQEFINKALDNI